MKLKTPQLDNVLKRSPLAPVYLLSGNEPLQEMECADAIRNQARAQGYSERVVFTLESRSFDWKTLSTEANSLSLFANRRLLELRLGEKIPADNDGKTFTNSKAFHAYLAAPPPDTLLLITSAKLDSKAQKTKWVQAVDKIGVVVFITAPEAARMPEWIQQRLATHGLHAQPEALAVLAERAEGHLLAAAQEIEKLRLLYPGGELNAAQVLEAVADSARFEVFAWLEIVLAGNVARLTRQLRGLHGAGVEPILVATLLEREVRSLAQIAYALRAGQSPAQVMAKFRVWGNRKALVPQAVKRHSPAGWRRLLLHAVRVEHTLKGMEPGNTWDELLRVALRVAGMKVPEEPPA